jgi:hypothetical protein
MFAKKEGDLACSLTALDQTQLFLDPVTWISAGLTLCVEEHGEDGGRAWSTGGGLAFEVVVPSFKGFKKLVRTFSI